VAAALPDPLHAAVVGWEGAGCDRPLGVLSTASVARLVIGANRDSKVTRFVAVASRGPSRAARGRAGSGGSFGSYQALLACDLVDAVYVALPVSLHTPLDPAGAGGRQARAVREAVRDWPGGCGPLR
jgi:predicted dehydrogenase